MKHTYKIEDCPIWVNLRVTGLKEIGVESLFKKVMSENFPNLEKYINI